MCQSADRGAYASPHIVKRLGEDSMHNFRTGERCCVLYRPGHGLAPLRLLHACVPNRLTFCRLCSSIFEIVDEFYIDRRVSSSFDPATVWALLARLSYSSQPFLDDCREAVPGFIQRLIGRWFRYVQLSCHIR